MSNKSVCVDCKYFYGYDGVGELWVGCALHGDFKVKAVNCKDFEKKVTKADLLKKIRKLEEENRKLKKARDKSDTFIVKKGLGAEFLEWCVENE